MESNLELHCFGIDKSTESTLIGSTASTINNQAIVIGGYNKADINESLLAIKCIDLISAEWIQCLVTSNNIFNRYYHASVAIKDNIYVFGGFSRIDGKVNIFGDILKIDKNIFGINIKNIKEDTLVKRYGLSANVINDLSDHIILFGGMTQSIELANNSTSFTYFADVNLFTPTTNLITAIVVDGLDKPTVRAFHSSCICGPNNNLLVVCGGQTENKRLLNDLWILDLTDILNAIKNGISLTEVIAVVPPVKGGKGNISNTPTVHIAKWTRILLESSVFTASKLHSSYTLYNNNTESIDIFIFGGLSIIGANSMKNHFKTTIKKDSNGKFISNDYEAINISLNQINYEFDLDYSGYSLITLPINDNSMIDNHPIGILILEGERIKENIELLSKQENIVYLLPLLHNNSMLINIMKSMNDKFTHQSLVKSSSNSSNNKEDNNHHIEYPNGDIYNGEVLNYINIEEGVVVDVDDIDNNTNATTTNNSSNVMLNTSIEQMIPHGSGTMNYHDGSYYEGIWNNGLKNGKGKLIMSDQSIYEGDFINDKQDGEGIFTFANGIDQYIGSFKDNTFHGYGKLYYQYNTTNTSSYIGEFLNGLYDGKGIYKVNNEYELNSIWSKGTMINDGYATSYPIESFNCNIMKPIEDSVINNTIKLSNKSTFAKKARLPDNNANDNNDENGSLITKILVLNGKYTGPLYNGIPSGELGICLYEDGSQYSGYWKSGKKNGLGTYIFANKDEYHGKWVGDKRCGWGKLQTNEKSNNSYEGIWYNNVPHGEGIMHYKDGTYYSGEFKHGKRCGYGRLIQLEDDEMLTDEIILCEGQWREDVLVRL